MIKLAFVIESLHLGGAEKSLVTLLQNLDFSKYEVELLVFNKGGFFSDAVPKGVKVKVLPFPKLSFIERIQFWRKRKFGKKIHHAQILWQILGNKCEKVSKKYTIAVAYNQGFATYFTDKYISAEKKFSWLNTDYQKAGYSIELDFPIYKNYNSVIAVSQENEYVFLQELKRINKMLPTEIIKDITDDKEVKQNAQQRISERFDSEKINIVSVGRLVEAKGFDLAIEVCQILKNKNIPIHWMIIGEGSERKNLEKQIQDLHLENDFTLIGARKNPYPYMKAADIYVQTSRFEGLGLTVIEAAILCKPIVSTNFPTVYGILEDGKTGLIAEMNAEAIAVKIECLIRDVQLKNTLVERLHGKQNTDKEQSLQKIEKLFHHV